MRKAILLFIALVSVIAPMPIHFQAVAEAPELEEPPSMPPVVDSILNPTGEHLENVVVAPPTPVPTPTPKLVKKVVASKTAATPEEVTERKGVITKWAAEYGVDADRLIRVAKCESGFRQFIVNESETPGNSPSGLFQFKPQTFYGNAKSINLAGADIWNIEHQAQVAAYMFSIGQARQWECK